MRRFSPFVLVFYLLVVAGCSLLPNYADASELRPRIHGAWYSDVDSIGVPDDTAARSEMSLATRPDTLHAATPDSTIQVESVAERIRRLMCDELFVLLEDELFDKTQLGLYIYDLTDDKMIFQKGAKQRLRPASTMKVLTAISAIDCLGGSFTFRTDICSDSLLRRDTLCTNLYVKGVMDPLFGRQDLERFAALLADSAVTCWRGDLILDISHKDTLAAGWGWCWDDDTPSLSPLLCDRDDAFAETLASVLSEKNILWQGGVLMGAAPPSVVTLTRHTHTLDQVLLPMLKKSDNQMAEAVFYSIAAHSGKKYAGRPEAVALINGIIKNELNLIPSDYKIADGSGLSLYNYVTPELMVQLLRYAYQNKRIYNHLKPSLPVMGEDGTLKKRCKGTSAQGKVFAKTGTVSGVSSLAGYAQAAHGHTLCFAIINQGVETSKIGRDFQDKVCNVLTREYE